MDKPTRPLPSLRDTARARELRRDQTSAERLLWSRLRNRQVAGAKFKRQVPFGPYVVDFCCSDARLVIELDGPSHVGNDAEKRDRLRTAHLEAEGYRVLRFWNAEVFDNLDGVCDTILAAFESNPTTLTLPSP